jgi:hypothetical protein
VSPVLDAGQHAPHGGRVAGPFVRDHHSRRSLLLTKHQAQEALGRRSITALLDQNVQHEPVADLQLHLVEVPLVRCPAPPATKSGADRRADLPAPQPDGLVADLHTPLGEHLLDIAVAEGEPVVQPRRD